MYFTKERELLDKDVKLIDQYHSTDDIDEKNKIFDKINKNIKKYNETNNKSVKLYERLNPEEKIIFEEEQEHIYKRVDLFNEKWKKIKEEFMRMKNELYRCP
jgi:DNA repair exonuclease SbcCD ATPase subunit